MKIELAVGVDSDLEAIGDYIARHNPRRALSFVRELRAYFKVIANNPYGYRLREHLGDGVRIAPFGKYLVVFRVVDDVMKVDGVASGYRDPARW